MIAGETENKADSSKLLRRYTEIYEFNADSTFRKYRSDKWEAKGTYTSKYFSDDDYGIIATYNNKELSYSKEAQVYFRKVELDLLVESYMASDGPSYYYQRIK